MPADQPNEEPEILDRLRRGESIESYETVRCRKDGRLVDISLTISPIIDDEGHTVGASKIARDIGDRKRAQESLRQSHANLEYIVDQRTTALRELSSSLMHLQDEERRRISRELHDSTGQDLTGLKLDLVGIGREVEKISPELAGRIAENAEFISQISDNLRTVSYLLHPPLLDELGLRSAVNWYVEGFSKRSGIQVGLDMPGQLERLPDALELVLFRILQESLTNIHRHSHSSSVDIQLGLGTAEVMLRVRDYGQGIPPKLLEQFRIDGTGVGVGLRSMRERISELGGRFEIQSDKNGTLIRVTVPLSVATPKSEVTVAKASAGH